MASLAQRQLKLALDRLDGEQRRLEMASVPLEMALEDLRNAKRERDEPNVQEAEKKVQEAEKKVQEAKKEVQEAEKKVQEAKKEVQEAEKKVQEAEKKVQEAEKKVQEAKMDTQAGHDSIAKLDLFSHVHSFSKLTGTAHQLCKAVFFLFFYRVVALGTGGLRLGRGWQCDNVCQRAAGVSGAEFA